MTSLPLDPAPDLPEGYTARIPGPDDIEELTRLGTERRQRLRGSGALGEKAAVAEVLGAGSWTRRHVIAEAPDGSVVGWATVHDRAAGRTMVFLTVDPDHSVVAPGLIAWQEQVAKEYGAQRGLAETQLDGLIDEADADQAGWLTDAGYRKTRTWLNMTRPVAADEQVPGPREGVTVRRVAVHELEDGTTMPVAEDLHAVHRVLEESFEDHFNSYRESFAEFAQRLREDPGHRWDHWWLALVPDEETGEPAPGGALVSSVMGADAQGKQGSYIDYIGVHRRARGRGVAKALLHTVIADAVERDRNRVSLEVDADSPTGADGLYRSLGWKTDYVTESWQRDVATGHVEED